MDKKEDFAERRRRQREKLSLQRAERRIADSVPTQPSSARCSSISDRPIADSPGSSENTDDAYVHVDKADAEEAEIVSAQPPKSSSNTSGATLIAAGSSTATKPALSPVKLSTRQFADLSNAVSPAKKAAEAMGKLQVSNQAVPKQAKSLVVPFNASEAPETTHLQASLSAPSQKHPVAAAMQRGQQGGKITDRVRPAKGPVSVSPESNVRSPKQKQDVQLGPSNTRASANSSAPEQQVVSYIPERAAL